MKYLQRIKINTHITKQNKTRNKCYRKMKIKTKKKPNRTYNIKLIAKLNASRKRQWEASKPRR